MPRAEAGTPKAISNAIKSKGLQKLKFFCQACQKQCRDANGFKCHIQTEAHQRQLLLVAENPGRFLEDYNKEFLKNFMYLFKTRYGSKRVSANVIYQEYIKDRQHVHMNATRWCTLSGFVQWLGRNGYAIVERSENRWFITYVDRDPETLKRQENAKKRDKVEKDYEERMAKVIDKQMMRGKALEKNYDKDCTSNETKILKREDEKDKIVLRFSNLIKSDNDSSKLSSKLNEEKKTEENQTNDKIREKEKNYKKNLKKKYSPDSELEEKEHFKKLKNKKSALFEIMNEEEYKKRSSKNEFWIIPNLIVKIISKKVPINFFNKKGLIEKVENKHLAHVKMFETNTILKLDQSYLETVIPKEGSIVKVVNGGYCGENASLLNVDVKKLCATIKIETGLRKGRVVDNVELEFICKFVND